MNKVDYEGSAEIRSLVIYCFAIIPWNRLQTATDDDHYYALHGAVTHVVPWHLHDPVPTVFTRYLGFSRLSVCNIPGM